jgi:hypothetical protein
MLLVLNAPEPAGLSNNGTIGDFYRVIQPCGIEFIDSLSYHDRYTPTYVMTYARGGGISLQQKLCRFLQTDYSVYKYLTSQFAAVKLAKIFSAVSNRIAGKPTALFQMFWMGLIYTVLFGFAIYLILRFIFRRFGRVIFLFASAVFCFAFCDQGYLLYFNSFYGEAAQYVFTFLCIGLFLHLMEMEKQSLPRFVLYIAVLLMAASKAAYAPVGILFSFAPLSLLPPKRVPRMAVLSLMTIVTGLIVIFSAMFTPQWMEDDTNFNAVFSGVLKYSRTPEQDLAELDLDPSLSVLKGSEAYQKKYPIDILSGNFQKGFYDKIGKGKIALFYARHPMRWLRVMRMSADYAKSIRPMYLTNTQNPSAPIEQSHRFSVWESVRAWSGISSFPVTVDVFILTFALIVYIIAFAEAPAGTGAPLACLLGTMAASALYNFLIPYISNGVCDLAKHMFGFVHFYDLLVFILLGTVIQKLEGRLKNKNYSTMPPSTTRSSGFTASP